MASFLETLGNLAMDPNIQRGMAGAAEGMRNSQAPGQSGNKITGAMEGVNLANKMQREVNSLTKNKIAERELREATTADKRQQMMERQRAAEQVERQRQFHANKGPDPQTKEEMESRAVVLDGLGQHDQAQKWRTKAGGLEGAALALELKKQQVAAGKAKASLNERQRRYHERDAAAQKKAIEKKWGTKAVSAATKQQKAAANNVYNGTGPASEADLSAARAKLEIDDAAADSVVPTRQEALTGAMLTQKKYEVGMAKVAELRSLRLHEEADALTAKLKDMNLELMSQREGIKSGISTNAKIKEEAAKRKLPWAQRMMEAARGRHVTNPIYRGAKKVMSLSHKLNGLLDNAQTKWGTPGQEAAVSMLVQAVEEASSVLKDSEIGRQIDSDLKNRIINGLSKFFTGEYTEQSMRVLRSTMNQIDADERKSYLKYRKDEFDLWTLDSKKDGGGIHPEAANMMIGDLSKLYPQWNPIKGVSAGKRAQLLARPNTKKENDFFDKSMGVASGTAEKYRAAEAAKAAKAAKGGGWRVHPNDPTREGKPNGDGTWEFRPIQIQKRADGGPVEAGQPYLVGERGPEVVVPEQNGTVMPNEQGNLWGNPNNDPNQSMFMSGPRLLMDIYDAVGKHDKNMPDHLDMLSPIGSVIKLLDEWGDDPRAKKLQRELKRKE